MSLLDSRCMQFIGICVGFIMLISLAHGGAECASLGADCDGGSGWDPMHKLDEIGTRKYDQVQSVAAKWPQKSRTDRWDKTAYGFEEEVAKEEVIQAEKEPVKTAESAPEETAESEEVLERSNEFKTMLAPIKNISEPDILIDVSENATEFVYGAVVLPYDKFLRDGGLKSVAEVSQILGDAGISQNDSVVVYGECLPCGGGPAASTYVYWIMKFLGHENIRVMDGTVTDWKALGLPTTNENNTGIRPATSYIPNYTPEFIAAYDYVKSGSPHIVDARSMQDFGAGSIPGAINIPFESVIKDNKIRDETALTNTFAVLDEDRPVVVYTATGIKASVVWFALELMGYDAKLYSWQDWLASEAPKGNSSDCCVA
jgi:thiosulfate/3-mercaptopyruvate sulfurtransferase